MGQVPAKLNMHVGPIGLVGDGRVARHLAHYFSLARIEHLRWTRVSPVDLRSCSYVFIAISDRAIEGWAIEARRCGRVSPEAKLLHLSGALHTPHASGLHPLMAFGTQLYERRVYESIPFIEEVDGARFHDVLPGLPNPTYALSHELRGRYHALCVLSGNLNTFLWQQTSREFEESLGIPAHALLPYLDATVRNLKAEPKTALTGPIARGDQGTIEANLKALEGHPLQFIYRSFLQTWEAYVRGT